MIHVAAAVIANRAGEVLLARRPEHVHQGGLWEFPGGKLESEEDVEQALARELHEELGLTPTACRPLIRVRHDYPDKSVLLDVWRVDAWEGEPHGREGQPIQWVAASCHTLEEVARACDIGVDFLVVSPVAATASHPGARPIGWSGLQALTERATVPVYALGGMTMADLESAWQHGAQGIAAIRGLWDEAVS